MPDSNNRIRRRHQSRARRGALVVASTAAAVLLGACSSSSPAHHGSSGPTNSAAGAVGSTTTQAAYGPSADAAQYNSVLGSVASVTTEWDQAMTAFAANSPSACGDTMNGGMQGPGKDYFDTVDYTLSGDNTLAPNVGGKDLLALLGPALNDSQTLVSDYTIWAGLGPCAGSSTLTADGLTQAKTDGQATQAAWQAFLSAYNPVARHYHQQTYTLGQLLPSGPPPKSS